ncbi:MAG: hypothetical protein IT442_16690 [Phycisphaeraceae bacterium]|nr:hypothetical protein [Phycisphaeraceae bacterium]
MLERPTIQTITLDAARVDSEMQIAGNQLMVIDASSPTAYATAKVNVNDNQCIIPLRAGTRLTQCAIESLFLSNAAQPGQWLKLLTFGDPSNGDFRHFTAEFPRPEEHVARPIRTMPGTGNLVVPFHWASTDISEQLVWTCPAGKTAVIDWLCFGPTGAAAVTLATLVIRDDEGTLLQELYSHAGFFEIPHRIRLSAGQAIWLKSSSGVNAAFVHGYATIE